MYTIAKVLLTTRQVELIARKEFVNAFLDVEDKAFIVYIASISQDLDVCSFWKAQIVLLKTNKAPNFDFFLIC